MAPPNFKNIFSLALPLLQLVSAAPQAGASTTLATIVVPTTSISTPSYTPTPSVTPRTSRNFTTLNIAIYPNPLNLNGSLCNATQAPEIRTVSYFMLDGWAITDGDIIFGTEADIQAASVSNTPVITRGEDVEDLTKRSMSIYPQSSAKWPGGNVYYKWAAGLDTARKNDFLAAAKLWTDRLPFLHFIEDNAHPDARTIAAVAGSTSSSLVGRVAGGGTILIGASRTVGIVAHEIGHSKLIYFYFLCPSADEVS